MFTGATLYKFLWFISGYGCALYEKFFYGSAVRYRFDFSQLQRTVWYRKYFQLHQGTGSKHMLNYCVKFIMNYLLRIHLCTHEKARTAMYSSSFDFYSKTHSRGVLWEISTNNTHRIVVPISNDSHFQAPKTHGMGNLGQSLTLRLILPIFVDSLKLFLK